MIRAHMAMYPIREKMLLQAVRSILDQVDMLHLCMTDWKEVPPEFQDHPKVSAFVPEEDQKRRRQVCNDARSR